jgi:hypothetical protein
MHVDAPSLRIIPEDLWQATQVRLSVTAARWPNRGGGGRAMSIPSISWPTSRAARCAVSRSMH